MILRDLLFRIRKWYAHRNLYTCCRELPLSHFMKCVCDNDLSVLRKRGWVSRQKLQQAWDRIREEYACLSGDRSYEKSFLLSKEIARENGKLVLIHACLNVLSCRYSRSCIAYLAGLGYLYDFPEQDREAFRKDLEKVKKKAKQLSMELNNKRKQYAKLVSGREKRVSSETFIRSLALLSRYMGYRLEPARMSVEEYVVIQKQYEREMRAHASLKNNKV